jgi:hypothetical protein
MELKNWLIIAASLMLLCSVLLRFYGVKDMGPQTRVEKAITLAYLFCSGGALLLFAGAIQAGVA